MLGLAAVIVDVLYFRKLIIVYKSLISLLFSYYSPFSPFYYSYLDVFKVVLVEFVILSLIGEVVNIAKI